jgi:hypothetical protein
MHTLAFSGEFVGDCDWDCGMGLAGLSGSEFRFGDESVVGENSANAKHWIKISN